MSRHAHRWGAILGSLTLAVVTTVVPATASSPAPGASSPSGAFPDVTIYRGDGARQGVYPGPAPDGKPVEVWTFKGADGFRSTPILVHGVLYLGDESGTIYAVDAATGTERWRFATGGAVRFVSYADGAVYAGDGDGTAWSLDATSGAERWHAALGTNNFSAPVVDGAMYVGTADGRLVALDTATGTEGWSYKVPAAVGRVTVVGGIAYFSDADGVMYAVRIGDTSELWHQRAISTNLGYATVANGMVFMATQQGAGDPSGELYGVDAGTGTVVWRFRSPSGRAVSPAAIADGVLYVPTSDDGVYALRADDGQVVWHVAAPQNGFTAAPLASGQLFVTSNDGVIHDLRISDGAELWRMPIATDTNAGAIVTSGFVFQADSDGILHAFGSAAAVPPAKPVPLSPAPSAAARLPALDLLATFDSRVTSGLDQPSGMDIGPDGLLYVVNARTSEILVVDGEGTVVRRWGKRGTGNGQFDFARVPTDPISDTGGVAVAEDGTVYVAESGNHRVQVFDARGDFLRAFGSYGRGDGQFLEPLDLAVGPDGSVYVVDDVRDDIQQFSANGAFVRTIGSHGSGDGELNFTGSIFVAPDATILNADWANSRVQAWDPAGTFQWTLGSAGSAPGGFTDPADVAVDQGGNIYVTDHGRVQVFDAKRHLIAISDGLAAVPGEFQGSVGAIVIDHAGNAWVGLPAQDQILKMRLPASTLQP